MTSFAFTVLQFLVLAGVVLVFVVAMWAFVNARQRWRAALLGPAVSSAPTELPRPGPARPPRRRALQNRRLPAPSPHR